MRNLLDISKCAKFSPSFTNWECDYYSPAEDKAMEVIHGQCGFCKLPNSYLCVADITRPIPLSHSSAGDFCTCHYLYMLKKILGIQVRPPFLNSMIKAGKLWDIIRQKSLGGDVSIKDTISEYEIDPYIVSKVRAIYHAYKEFGLGVDPGYELQAPVNLTYDIHVPASSFIPSIDIGKDAVNLWADRSAGETREWIFPLHLTGFYDLKYANFFGEDKLSGRPEMYLDPFFIQSQNGTYFLADPSLEYCIQHVVLFPQQREKKRIEESPDEIYKRVFDDVISKPSKYFLGLNKEKARYGKKLYRTEFDLKSLELRYIQIAIEILAARWTGNFYKNWKVCNNVLPGISCDFQSICQTGKISETMYSIRGKE